VREPQASPAPPLPFRHHPHRNNGRSGGQAGEESRASLRRVLLDSLDALYRFILVRVGKNRHVAEDLLQQTAVVALRHERAPERGEEQASWLRGIARNLIRRHWRETGNGAGRFIGDPEGARRLLEEIEHDGCPAERLAAADAADQLLCAIADLPAADQALLYEFYKRNRSLAEIGERLGITPKAVEARLYRMRARLRAALGDLDGSES